MRGERTRSDENQKPALSRRFARFPRSATGPFSHNPKVAGSNPAPATTDIGPGCAGSESIVGVL